MLQGTKCWGLLVFDSCERLVGGLRAKSAPKFCMASLLAENQNKCQSKSGYCWSSQLDLGALWPGLSSATALGGAAFVLCDTVSFSQLFSPW